MFLFVQLKEKSTSHPSKRRSPVKMSAVFRREHRYGIGPLLWFENMKRKTCRFTVSAWRIQHCLSLKADQKNPTSFFSSFSKKSLFIAKWQPLSKLEWLQVPQNVPIRSDQKGGPLGVGCQKKPLDLGFQLTILFPCFGALTWPIKPWPNLLFLSRFWTQRLTPPSTHFPLQKRSAWPALAMLFPCFGAFTWPVKTWPNLLSRFWTQRLTPPSTHFPLQKRSAWPAWPCCFPALGGTWPVKPWPNLLFLSRFWTQRLTPPSTHFPLQKPAWPALAMLFPCFGAFTWPVKTWPNLLFLTESVLNATVDAAKFTFSTPKAVRLPGHAVSLFWSVCLARQTLAKPSIS